jgi:flagellar biosynthesis/type III secretory pathway M-ring protein FliF/YscJ
MIPILAHGGTAGAVAETAFILVPLVVFSWLSRVSRRRREREEAEAAEAEEAAEAGEAAGDRAGEGEQAP